MTLVSLCFVAVMGIALAGYIAVCSRAMNMSNRTFHDNLTKQLAEAGIDEALRAFNKNDWANWTSNPTNVTSGTWTLDTTNKRATRTITFDTGKLGQGITGTIKMRIDNYDANQLNSPWNNGTIYHVNDLVGYNGIWYRCVLAHTAAAANQPYNLNYWAPGGIPWKWNNTTTYSLGDAVCDQGNWYYYSSATPGSNSAPPGGNWTPIPAMNPASPTANSMRHTGGSWELYNGSSWVSAPLKWRWYNGWMTYNFSDPVFYNNVWYSSIQPLVTANFTVTSITNEENTTNIGAKMFDGDTNNSSHWTSTTSFGSANVELDLGGNYLVDQVDVYPYSNRAYQYKIEFKKLTGDAWTQKVDRTSNTTGGTVISDTIATPMSARYMKMTVTGASGYSGPYTAINEIKLFGKTEGSTASSAYISSPITLSVPAGDPSVENLIVRPDYSSSSYWQKVTDPWLWSSGLNYNLGDVVYYSATSLWYRCILSTASLTPTNTTYWSNAPLLSRSWDSAKQYSQYDTVRYNGQWYLALSSNTGTVPASNPGTWALAPSSLAAWDSTKYYNLNDTVSYSGTWYRCILAHSAQTPTSTTYWASTSGASYQWSASTAYAVNNYLCYDGVWYNCIAATTANAGQTPNNTTYWTAAWANSFGVTTGAPVVYAEGTIAITGSPPIKTQLRATIAPAPLFPNALGATTLINLAGTGTIDSYDSSLGTYDQTTSPFTAAAPNRGSSAVIAGGLTTDTAVTLTSARVNGYVAAPWASTTPYWSYGGNAILTSVLSPTVPSPRVDLTRVSRSPNIPQFDIQPVPGGTALSVSGAVTIGTPGATTPSIYNVAGSLQLDNSSKILTIVGPVIININGDLRAQDTGSGPGKIVIATTGSARIHFSAQLYVGSYGSVGIQNLTLDPRKCILIGTSTANFAGNHYYWAGGGTTPISPFYGVIYMPNAYVSTYTNVTIHGAVSAKNIAFPDNGGALHYDTSLRYATFGGVAQPYTVAEWRELSTAEQATMP